MIDRLNAALEGRYRIERELGEGGMATVYLAEDLKHKRQVALKVLRPELAAVVGAERFLAEIETTANLQHPHILPLFDSGEADGFLFYVMPYVEDETLRDRLDREKQLPVDQAVELARKVASALQHAHDRGVVHRDIKPANILLSEGEPLVADFGIALAVNSAGGGRITETGLSLGTPHYMSPEQASGDRSLDPRSDVYALGCVLYEALVGEPPFPGPTPQAVLARILTGRAQRVAASRPTVPAHIDAVVARALEKLPADRFETVADFRKALDDPAFRHMAAGEPSPMPDASRARAAAGRRLLSPLAVVLLAAVAIWGWLRPDPPGPFQAFKVVLDDAGPEFGPVMALSPAGDQLVYVTETGGLAVKPLGAADSRVLPVEQNSRTPFFSPDGSSVAFHSGAPETSELRWVRIDGGGAIRMARGVYPGGTWSEDGYIYYTPDSDYSLWRVRAQGGEPERVPQPDGHEFSWPQAVEGGDRILVQASAGADGVDRLSLLDPDTGELAPIDGPGLEQAAFGRYAGGYLFWVDADLNLLAARLDLERARLSSPAVTLGTQTLVSGGASVTVADNGTLAYATGIGVRAGLMENLAWVERDGSVEVLEDRLAEQIGDFDGLAIGPGERYVAVQIDPPGELQNERQEIWILDTRQSTLYPLTFDGTDFDPEWLDARNVAYIRHHEGRTHLYVQPFDRSGPERVLLELDQRVEDFEVGPDGTLLLMLEAGPDDPELGLGLYTVDPEEPDTLRRLVDTRFDEGQPDISPDGRWVAYTSDESGRNEVYVRAFPGGGRPWPISTEGGDTPRWGPDGDELYFRVSDRLVVAALDYREGVDVVGYTELFSTIPFELSGYQAHSDGQRLLMIREGEGAETVSTVIMLNVFDEIERRLTQ